MFKSIRTFNMPSLRKLIILYMYLKVGHVDTRYVMNTLKLG